MAGHARLTLVPLPVAARSHLRAAHLPRLAASGPLGELLARQCRAYAVDSGMTELGRAHGGLPDDLVNIHWDPVACAVALGWSGAVVQERRVRTVLEAERLRFEHDPGGRRTRVLADLDVQAFDELWIEGRRAGPALAGQRCSPGAGARGLLPRSLIALARTRRRADGAATASS
jgi:hypothetical protein